jgi:hypothetical protein
MADHSDCVVKNDTHDGEMTQCDGKWFCWKHYLEYNTDGVIIDGRKQKAEEGDNPWYNQI